MVRAAGYRGAAERCQGCAAEMIAVQVVECAAPLDRNAHAAERVVADGRRYAVGDLLLIVAEEGVGRGAAADLLDPPAIHLIPILLDQVTVVVLHLRQPVLSVPHQRLLAIETLVAHNHVAVGVIVEAVGPGDAVNRMVRPDVVVVVRLPVERGQPVRRVVAVRPAHTRWSAAPARHSRTCSSSYPRSKQ